MSITIQERCVQNVKECSAQTWCFVDTCTVLATPTVTFAKGTKCTCNNFNNNKNK